MLRGFRILTITLLSVLLVLSCKKNNDNPPGTPPPNSGNELSYGDSVFYLQNQAGDYIITPNQLTAGKYISFPDGLQLDNNTGAIDVSKSETGLKYLVSFVPDGTTDTISTKIVISGINFLDGFYILANGDSVARPLYNAKAGTVPGINNGTIFDEGSNCNSQGCTVNVGDGEINLAQTVRNGVFGPTPTNNDRHEFELDYRINDKSGKALNTIRVKLYYFDTMNDVTQEVYDIIDSRVGAIIDGRPVFIPAHPMQDKIAVNSVAPMIKSIKPRPPCIFIVSR